LKARGPSRASLWNISSTLARICASKPLTGIEPEALVARVLDRAVGLGRALGQLGGELVGAALQLLGRHDLGDEAEPCASSISMKRPSSSISVARPRPT
jgi:hypothetical protein